MTRKITTYSFDHPTDAQASAELASIGSFTDESTAKEEIIKQLGWDTIIFSDLKQVDQETAAFCAYKDEEALARDPLRTRAPRILQRNVPVEGDV